MSKATNKTKTNNIKKLNLTSLNTLDKQNDELQTIYVANNSYSLQINKKFRQTKIQRLLLDFQDAATTLKKDKVDINDVGNLFSILNMLFIVHFTNLGISLDLSTKEGIAKLIKVSEKLIDTGVFEEIISSFDSKEIEKVNKLLDKSNNMSEKIGEMFVQSQINQGVEFGDKSLEFEEDNSEIEEGEDNS